MSPASRCRHVLHLPPLFVYHHFHWHLSGCHQHALLFLGLASLSGLLAASGSYAHRPSLPPSSLRLLSRVKVGREGQGLDQVQGVVQGVSRGGTLHTQCRVPLVPTRLAGEATVCF